MPGTQIFALEHAFSVLPQPTSTPLSVQTSKSHGSVCRRVCVCVCVCVCVSKLSQDSEAGKIKGERGPEESQVCRSHLLLALVWQWKAQWQRCRPQLRVASHSTPFSFMHKMQALALRPRGRQSLVLGRVPAVSTASCVALYQDCGS
jgi:hypothetical protein